LLAEAGTLDRPPKVESRVATAEATPEALAKAREEFAKAHTNYRVEKEEKLPDGRTLVKDRWDEDGKACSGMRLFVPTTKGFIELRNMDPLRDATAFASVTKSMAASSVVGR
jgi:hypothetical protein